MKNLIMLIRRFVPPYKRYVIWVFILNLLSTIFSLFSFATIIPILQILFGMQTKSHLFMDWSQYTSMSELVDITTNNLFFYIEQMIVVSGAATTLLYLGLFLVIMTVLKTGTTYLASSSLVPVRTGVLRDLRNQIYAKIICILSHLSSRKLFSHGKDNDRERQNSHPRPPGHPLH